MSLQQSSYNDVTLLIHSVMVRLWAQSSDCWKRKGLSRRRKLENVGGAIFGQSIPDPRSRNVEGPTIPTVDSRNIGTTRRLELAERSARRPCRSATRSSGPRYRGAVSCRTLYVEKTRAPAVLALCVCSYIGVARISSACTDGMLSFWGFVYYKGVVWGRRPQKTSEKFCCPAMIYSSAFWCIIRTTGFCDVRCSAHQQYIRWSEFRCRWSQDLEQSPVLSALSRLVH